MPVDSVNVSVEVGVERIFEIPMDAVAIHETLMVFGKFNRFGIEVTTSFTSGLMDSLY